MKNELMKNAKDTMKLGMFSQVGSYTMGSMGAMPGMPKTPVPGMVNTSLGIMNTGQMAKTGMSVAKMLGKK